MKGTVFQPRMLQLNLDNVKQVYQKKIGECAGAGLEPTTFCVQAKDLDLDIHDIMIIATE